MRFFTILISIIFLLFAAYFEVKGQNDSTLTQIGLKVGPSIPVGNFSDKDVDNDAAGFAMQGFSLDGFADHYFGKNFGVHSQISVRGHDLDDEAFLADFSNMLSDPDAFYWHFGALAGPSFKFDLEKKFSYYGGLSLGLFLGGVSGGEFTYTVDGETEVYSYDAIYFSFGVAIRNGLKYDLYENKLSALACLDYYYQNAGMESEVNNDTDKQPMGMFNITFGLSYNLHN